MNEYYLGLINLSVSLQGQPVLTDINLTIKKGEQWAIIGPSGSGKTVLAHTIAGSHFCTGEIRKGFEKRGAVCVIDQQHRFKDLSNQANFYYQQRFNSFDADTTITVGQAIAAVSKATGSLPAETYIRMLNIDHLLDEPLIQLSNGENKRLQLVKALLQQPALLLMDQPFTGLDVTGRNGLAKLLDNIGRNGQQMILFLSSHELPGFISHVAELEDGMIVSTSTKAEFEMRKSAETKQPEAPVDFRQLFSPPVTDYTVAVKMVNVNIRYENRQVLKNFCWEVKAGERWSLSGPNGSGKSTLLSLITGDNPQAYANEIYLFDQRRGTGESIWDIKQKIGFISPELHLYFDPSATAFQAIASGFFDTIGLFRMVGNKQEAIVMEWMHQLGIGLLRNRLLSRLSLGQQRLVLLARALVKSPAMLVLDEPCQGLDDAQISYFIRLIDSICKSFPVTLIYVSHYERELPECVDHFMRLPG